MVRDWNKSSDKVDQAKSVGNETVGVITSHNMVGNWCSMTSILKLPVFNNNNNNNKYYNFGLYISLWCKFSFFIHTRCTRRKIFSELVS